MKIALSKYQRYAALAAAAAIIVVQLYQFSEEGFEGYGWILSFVVAAGMAIVGIGPLQGTITASANAPATPTKPPLTQSEIEANHKKLRENAEVLAIEVEERAKVLSAALISARAEDTKGLRLVNPDGSASAVEKGLDSFMRDRALLFALGLVGIRQARRYNLYVTGIEYKDTEKKIFAALAREAISGMMAMGMPVDKDALMKSLLEELQAIRKCVVQSAEAAKRGDTDISKPLVDWLGGQGLTLKDDTLIKAALETK